MLTATTTTTFNLANVVLTEDDHNVAAYPVTREDGPGPLSAAEAVLERNGWRITGKWEHVAGGISGDMWTAAAEAQDGQR